MPWIEFKMYLEYMNYLNRWQTEDGVRENKMLDNQDKIRFGGKYSNNSIDEAKQSIKQKFT